MKTTHTILFAVLCTVFISLSLNSFAQTGKQGKWRLSIGADGGVPTGSIRDFSVVMLGATARLQYGITDKTALTFTSGYYNFFAKTTPIGSGGTPDDMGIVPVKVGIKSFVTGWMYLGAEAGAGLETPGGPAKLLLAPTVGFAYKHFDAGVRYEYIKDSHFNYGLMALRLAYDFGL